MLVHALRGAGADPGYLVGGEVRSTGANAGWGAGEWLVVEADESDRSLLKLAPTIAVVTNAELDHHTTYASRRDVDDTFRAFLALARDAVVPPDLAGLARRPAIFDADPQLTADGSRFDFDGVPVVLRVPGAHNARNAAAALTAIRLGRRGRGPGGVGARDLRGRGPPLRAPRHDHRRRPGRRRLRPPPDRGPGDDRGRSDARAAARRRVLSAAPVLAHPARGAGLRRARSRTPTSPSCSTCIRRARAAEDFPGVSGLLVAEAAADAGGGKRVAWMRTHANAESFLRSELREGDLLLTMGAGDVDAVGRAPARLGGTGGARSKVPAMRLSSRALRYGLGWAWWSRWPPAAGCGCATRASSPSAKFRSPA